MEYELGGYIGIAAIPKFWRVLALVFAVASLTSHSSAASARTAKCSDVFLVPAGCHWADTGLPVVRGRTYAIEILDMLGVRDAYIPVQDLNGWPWWAQIVGAPVFWARRQPFDPWFALIATVDGKDPRRVRTSEPYVAPSSGRLICYFNDAPWAHGNNRGTAKLRLIPAGSAPQRGQGPLAPNTRR